MSVTVLGDGEAVAKFRTVNPKSVVYFTATWCPPCKRISPIYATLSETYPNVAFGKVDIDDNQNSAMDFKISAVPTFVFSRGEETVNKLSGADEVQLEKFVKEL
jgi:thioredoxin 1